MSSDNKTSESVATIRTRLYSVSRQVAIPVVLALFHSAVFLGLYHQTVIAYGFWQLLPHDAIMEQPIWSLLLLHSQPPVLNGIFVLIHWIEYLTGVPAAFTTTGLFILLTFISAISWFEVARHLLESAYLATAVLVLLLLNPAWIYFERFLFYPNILLAVVGVMFMLAIRWARNPKTSSFIMLIACFCLLVYTRSLWHPISGTIILGCTSLFVFFRSGNRKEALLKVSIGTVIIVGLTAPWLIKNGMIFGSWSYSSWIELNLGGVQTRHFMITHDIEEEFATEYYGEKKLGWLKEYAAVSILDKNLEGDYPPDITINMNHYMIPALNSRGTKVVLSFYKNDPGYYFNRVLNHINKFDLPPFGVPPKFDDDLIGKYSTFWESVYYQIYHGAWFKHLSPLSNFKPSLFLLILLPLSLGGALVIAWKNRQNEKGFVLAFAAGLYVWLILMTFIVDGEESQRMRWHLEPLYLIMLFATLQSLFATVRRKWYKVSS